MLRTHLTFPQFYDWCRKAGGRFSYRVIITFIARQADVPWLYDELISVWSSLHDLTGRYVAVLFAAPMTMDPAAALAWWQSGAEYQAPGGVRLLHGEQLILAEDGEIVAPTPPPRSELALSIR